MQSQLSFRNSEMHFMQIFKHFGIILTSFIMFVFDLEAVKMKKKIMQKTGSYFPVISKESHCMPIQPSADQLEAFVIGAENI